MILEVELCFAVWFLKHGHCWEVKDKKCECDFEAEVLCFLGEEF